MARIRNTSRSLAREDGFTLPEMLMAAAMLVGLFAVMGASLTTIISTGPRVAERSAQIQTGRAMIEQLTRELREGSDLDDATASSLQFETFVRRQTCGGAEPTASASTPAIPCRVNYFCSDGRCMRSEAPPSGGSGSTRTMLEGLKSTQVFSYAPEANPPHVTVTLEYPGEDGSESITLSDGAAMRNGGLP